MFGKKFLTLVAMVMLVAVALVGCGGGEEAKSNNAANNESDVIKIGVYEPLTGINAAGGEMTVEGIKLANKLYPDVLGKKVELVIVDNKSEKQEAANAVERLVNENVDVIIGSYGSSLSMAGGPVAKDAGVPVIGCSPTNPLVTKDNEYYFRVCFIDPFQGTVMAKYAVETLGAKTAAIVQDVQQDYSVGLSKYFVDAFKELTGDENAIVAQVNYNTGDKDFSAQLTEVKAKNPDVIFAPGNFLECGILVEKARELGIDVPILGGDTWEAEEFLNRVGGLKDIYFSTHFTAEEPVTELSSTFLTKFAEEYPDKQVNAFAALGFDSYLLALDAINRAGSTDHDAIRDALAETENFQGATGFITLDENGDANKTAIIKKVADGKFVYETKVEPK
ncbi:branched-chain amino acid transport system substrate-binding protein [Desulfohalotomaculum tongense]|uniref:ABC transporter substrate-binding protein n=1 Tax=Desulforadius tongensis TaxID=1216062 RepID=UPI00195A263E|nr:ABC transporter substrate-binding protein [Desulforadius tongensis]MBM7853947.1 branched-chain amino acid transport system substrate-binding protein [Desulforadius tongensis]